MLKPIYRADHCGSFVRPASLRDARLAFRRGSIGRNELTNIEDRHILSVLNLQRQIGLPVVSDGEFRRDFWLSAVSEEFFDGMINEGVDTVKHPFLRDAAIADADVLVPPRPVVVNKLARKGRITASEIAFLRTTARGPFKVTLPSPVTLAPTAFKMGVTEAAYSDWHSLFRDYTKLIAAEVKDMIEDGVSYVQLDAPHYARYLVPDRQKSLTEFGVELEEEFAISLAAENECLAAATAPHVTTAVHICLGTFILGAQGPMGGAGEYESELLGRLIGGLDADVFLIEFSRRTGGAEALKNIPKNKRVCLGVLNTRDPEIESVDFVMRRVDAATKYLPVENISLSPNCGFSGGAARTWVDEECQKRKLAVVVEAATRIWGSAVQH